MPRGGFSNRPVVWDELLRLFVVTCNQVGELIGRSVVWRNDLLRQREGRMTVLLLMGAVQKQGG
jgi:hypothetical protein